MKQTWKRRVNYIAPWGLDWLIEYFVTEENLVQKLNKVANFYNKAAISLF